LGYFKYNRECCYRYEYVRGGRTDINPDDSAAKGLLYIPVCRLCLMGFLSPNDERLLVSARMSLTSSFGWSDDRVSQNETAVAMDGRTLNDADYSLTILLNEKIIPSSLVTICKRAGPAPRNHHSPNTDASQGI
jgi:hypothetical protein